MAFKIFANQYLPVETTFWEINHYLTKLKFLFGTPPLFYLLYFFVVCHNCVLVNFEWSPPPQPFSLTKCCIVLLSAIWHGSRKYSELFFIIVPGIAVGLDVKKKLSVKPNEGGQQRLWQKLNMELLPNSFSWKKSWWHQ